MVKKWAGIRFCAFLCFSRFSCPLWPCLMFHKNRNKTTAKRNCATRAVCLTEKKRKLKRSGKKWKRSSNGQEMGGHPLLNFCCALWPYKMFRKKKVFIPKLQRVIVVSGPFDMEKNKRKSKAKTSWGEVKKRFEWEEGRGA